MMQPSVLYHTAEYRGDHTAEVAIAVEADLDTTLRELISRTLWPNAEKPPDFYGRLEIRLAKPQVIDKNPDDDASFLGPDYDRAERLGIEPEAVPFGQPEIDAP